jgi:hypothetical protein
MRYTPAAGPTELERRGLAGGASTTLLHGKGVASSSPDMLSGPDEVHGRKEFIADQQSRLYANSSFPFPRRYSKPVRANKSKSKGQLDSPQM